MKKIKKILVKIWDWFKNRSFIQKVIIIIVLIGLVVFFNPFKKDSDEVSYQYGQVERGDITQLVSETGEIMSSNKTTIVSSIDGIVTEIFVDNGDKVNRGDNLFYVNSTATEQERAKAYSDYLSAKNSLESANSKKYTLESDMWQAHEKFEADSLDTELSVDDPIFIQTERDWKAAEATYINQDQSIAQAKAAVSNAWFNYQATLDGYVKATVNGTVANLAIASGQSVSSFDTTLIISSDAHSYVKVAINENDIIGVEKQQRAVISVDALETEVMASVDRVDDFGTVISDVVVYYVYLVLEETPVNLLPGMTTQVDIITEEKKDILVIQNTAIKPYQGEKAVQILDKDTKELVYQPITTGVSGDIKTEVTNGLEEGQQIILSEKSSGSNQGGGLFSPPGN